MADELADGNVRVTFYPACAVLSAPTTTELNAGISIATIITPDGLVGFEPDTADVPTGSLASVFNTVDIGRISFSGPMLRLKKQVTGDVTYTTLGTKGISGFLAIRLGLPEATAWASTQQLRNFPVKTGARRDLTPEENSVRKYEVPMKIYLPPNLEAVVA